MHAGFKLLRYSKYGHCTTDAALFTMQASMRWSTRHNLVDCPLFSFLFQGTNTLLSLLLLSPSRQPLAFQSSTKRWMSCSNPSRQASMDNNKSNKSNQRRWAARGATRVPSPSLIRQPSLVTSHQTSFKQSSNQISKEKAFEEDGGSPIIYGLIRNEDFT